MAVANDYEIVVLGIGAVLSRFPEHVEVIELDAGRPVAAPVDVILYDSFGQPQGASLDVAAAVADTAAKLIIISWNTEAELVQASLAAGANGYVAKSVEGARLVEAIVQVHAGEQVVLVPETSVKARRRDDADLQLGTWPGREAGLSSRESEILALICQGLSNQEITERALLGMNTIKTYIRSLYQKIEVTNRVEAVLWGVDHGFRPDRVRHRVKT